MAGAVVTSETEMGTGTGAEVGDKTTLAAVGGDTTAEPGNMTGAAVTVTAVDSAGNDTLGGVALDADDGDAPISTAEGATPLERGDVMGAEGGDPAVVADVVAVAVAPVAEGDAPITVVLTSGEAM